MNFRKRDHGASGARELGSECGGSGGVRILSRMAEDCEGFVDTVRKIMF